MTIFGAFFPMWTGRTWLVHPPSPEQFEMANAFVFFRAHKPPSSERNFSHKKTHKTEDCFGFCASLSLFFLFFNVGTSRARDRYARVLGLTF